MEKNQNQIHNVINDDLAHNHKTTEKIEVGFFGAPNSGKSTLFNALLQKKIAIISDKPQTTEKITGGMISLDNLTIQLVDTPGISFIKEGGQRGVLNKLAWEELENVQYPFFLVPANKPYIQDKFMEKASDFVVIITKIDRIKKENVPLIIERIMDLYTPKDVLCISAKYDIGVDQLLNYFLSLPHRQGINATEELALNRKIFLSDSMERESFSSMGSEELAIDMTREAIFSLLHGEVPYNIMIKNLQCTEGSRGIHIQQELLVPNVNYRIILFGSENLEKIRKFATKSLEETLNKKVFIKYTVKIQKK
jgi:GTP-binding protein Era